MNKKKFSQKSLILGLILLFLVGCSTSATPTPIPATPTLVPPTATPTPTGPKVGHWEGKPSVFFDVTSEGNIHNFSMTTPFRNSTCTITADEIKAEANGTFIISESVKVTDDLQNLISLGSALGIPAPAVTQTSSGDMIEATHIDGKFNGATALTGTYIIRTCENQFETSSGATPTWSAEWKSP